MKSTFKWKQGFESVVDNSRGHEIVMDLPKGKNGTDLGATALEICGMSLTGCVGTIFAVMAEKMRIKFSELEIELDAAKTDDDPTITAVSFVLKIKTEATKEKVQKCLDLTLENCPVGVLYRKAGVSISNEIEML